MVVRRTGAFDQVPDARRPIGRGVTELGLRTDLDVSPSPFMWLSFSNQTETMVRSATKHRSSLLNQGELNQADPTTQEAIAAGSSGGTNIQNVTRRGVRNIGYLRMQLALSDVAETLQPIAVQSAYHYDYDSTLYYDGVKQGPPAETSHVSMGFTIDGLGFSSPSPWSIEVERYFPIYSNQAVAPNIDMISFSLYQKI